MEAVISFLLLVISYFIIKKVRVKLMDSSKNCSMERVIKKRKQYRVFLIVFSIISLILFWVGTPKNETSIVSQFVVFIYLYLSINELSFLERTKPVTIDRVIKSGKYVLYLRGFSYDDYSTISQLKSNKTDNFSEYQFVNILGLYMPVFAVGMTKELYAPHGAKRVYLSDGQWENEVKILIENATIIVILINDSDNCIWEIEQSYNLSKTIYIIDNISKLHQIRAYFNKSHKYPFPIIKESHNILYKLDCCDDFIISEYENSFNSYKRVIKKIMWEKLSMKRWIIDARLLTLKGFIFALIMFLISLLEAVLITLTLGILVISIWGHIPGQGVGISLLLMFLIIFLLNTNIRIFFTPLSILENSFVMRKYKKIRKLL